ncbi:MAG: hypothetical protein ACK41E_04980 [Deinococcales bacterium]
MKTKFLLAAVAAVSLAGCSLDQFNFLPSTKIRAQISALEIDGEITRATGSYSVKQTSQTITFQAASGSLGAVITSFEARYEDQSGNPIGANPRPQTLNQAVEPGKTCTAVGSATSCTFEPGKISNPVSVSLLSEEAAVLFLTKSAENGVPLSGWRARITFFGTNSNGVPFTWEEVQAITCKSCVIK